jgi:hypothetical protein
MRARCVLASTGDRTQEASRSAHHVLGDEDLGSAVLWILKPAIDLSNGLGSVTLDMSRVMSDPWLALWGLLFVLVPRLHVETLRMHAEVLAAAIATEQSSVVPEMRASDERAGAERPT